MSTTKTLHATTDAELHYSVRGEGPTVLGLHGAFSTHEELAAALEPTFTSPHGYRRLYPDLPGMGDTPAHATIQSANDVLDLLDELISTEIGTEPFLVIGHSFGAHLARGLAARHPDQIAGLALICPMVIDAKAEAHVVVHRAGDPSRAIAAEHLHDYIDYFVVQTPDTAARFVDAVVPSLGRWDTAAVEQQMSNSTMSPDPDDRTFSAPTLTLTGRHDSLVGFRDQLGLVDRYPDSTHLVVADAGHALPHEHPTLTGQLLDDWLDRTTLHPSH